MSKSTAARQRAQSDKQAPPADRLTIGWMTTLLTTLCCELAAVGAWAYVRFVDAEARLLTVLSGLLNFAAVVMGFLLLVMTPIVLYRRRSNPPRAVVVLAVVVGVTPLVGMFLQGLG